MGVAGLVPWLRKHVSECFHQARGVPDQIVTAKGLRVYIDLNGWLHLAAWRHHHPDALMRDVVSRLWVQLAAWHSPPLTTTTITHRPMHVFIALDGCASVLKMRLQRERRSAISFSSSPSSSSSHSTSHSSIGDAESSSFSPFSFNSLLFTPGVPFMHQLEEYILASARRHFAPHLSHNVTVTVSGSGVSGEGEAKIAQDIMARSSHKPKDGNDVIVVMSRDSDALLHSLLYTRLTEGDVCDNDHHRVWVHQPGGGDLWFDASQAVRLMTDRSFFFPPPIRTGQGQEEDHHQGRRLWALAANFAGTDVAPRMRYGHLHLLSPAIPSLRFFRDHCYEGNDDHVDERGGNGHQRGPLFWDRLVKDVEMVRALAERHLAGLTRTELGHVRADQQRYRPAVPNDDVRRLAAYLFVHSWLLDFGVLHAPSTPDLFVPSQTWSDASSKDVGWTVEEMMDMGPSIADVVDCDESVLHSHLRQLHDLYYRPHHRDQQMNWEKVPGAVALTLVDPQQRHGVLSPTLIDVGKSLAREAWTAWPCSRLLTWYSHQIGIHYSSHPGDGAEAGILPLQPQTIRLGGGTIEHIAPTIHLPVLQPNA